MLELLQPDVIRHTWQLLHPYRPQIITCIPLQRFVTRVTVPVRQSRACPFKSLHQSWDLVFRRELEKQMDVIRNHTDLNDTGAVSLGFSEEER